MNYYLSVIRNYANFSGRARRSEFWMYTLFNTIFIIAAMILDNILGSTFDAGFSGASLPYGWLYSLYALFTIVPGLAVSVRRLHDVGKSGWMLLIILIPIVGPIWLLVLNCTDSQASSNKWGENPKLAEM